MSTADTKILFIPGWMNLGEQCGFNDCLNIWSESADLTRRWDVDYVVAHSAGCLAALYNWNLNRNFRLIFINPVFERKQIWRRWLPYFLTEGPPSYSGRYQIFWHIIYGLRKFNELLASQPLAILAKIPATDLLVIRGKNDTFLCGLEAVVELKKFGFAVREVPGAGHNWQTKFRPAIDSFLTNKVL